MHNETENINGKDKHASQTVRLSVNYFTLKYQSIGKIDHLSVVGGARFPAGNIPVVLNIHDQIYWP